MFYRDLFKKPARIVKGDGVYIYDESGKRYLDATGGSNAAIPIGHGVKPVIDAMLEQARKISFTPMHLFSNEPAEMLADEIAKIAPPGLTTTWFVNGGSEATDNAVKLARQFQLEKGTPGKFKVVTRWQSFYQELVRTSRVAGLQHESAGRVSALHGMRQNEGPIGHKNHNSP